MPYILNGEVYYNWLSVVRCRTFSTVKCTTTAASTQLKATSRDVTMATDSHSGSRASNPRVCCEILSYLLHKSRHYSVKEGQLTLCFNDNQVMLFDRAFSVLMQSTEQKFVCYIVVLTLIGH